MLRGCADSADPFRERVEWFLLGRWILHPNAQHVDVFRHVQIHEQVHEAFLAFRPIGSRPWFPQWKVGHKS